MTVVRGGGYTSLIISDDAATFTNGGRTAIEDGKIVMEKLTPGDGADFKLKLVNKSNVKIKFKVIISVNDASLLGGLDFAFDGKNPAVNGNKIETSWEEYGDALDKTFDLRISMPMNSGNEYKGLNMAFDMTVYAVQSNGVDNVVFAGSPADINAAVEGNTVVLTNDIISDEAIKITSAVNIDLCGRKIEGKTVEFENVSYSGTILIENGKIESTTPDAGKGIIYNYPLATGTLRLIENVTANENVTVGVNFSANTLYLAEAVTFLTVDGKTAAVEIAGDTTVKIIGHEAAFAFSIPEGAKNVRIDDHRVKPEGVESLPKVTVDVSANTENITVDVETIEVTGAGKDSVFTMVFIEDLKNVQTGETVKLKGNVKIDKNLTVYGKLFNIDLNGYDLIINGVFTMDYRYITDVPVDQWYSIANGVPEKRTTDSNPGFTKAQTGMFYIRSIYFIAGSGNFGFTCGQSLDSGYEYQCELMMFSWASAEANATYWSGFYSPFVARKTGGDLILIEDYRASETIVIGEHFKQTK